MKFLLFIIILPIVCGEAKKMLIETDDAITTKREVRIAASFKIDDSKTYHLTRFQPFNGENIHHMTLNACDEPGTDQKYWNSGLPPDLQPGYPRGNLCKEIEPKWLYGWAFRSTQTGLAIPEGYAFQIGKDTIYKYLVFEVHYSEPTISRSVNDSRAGILITYEEKPITSTAIATLDIKGNSDVRLPAKKTTTVDILSKVSATMHPLMFHVHIHGLGTKVSGYLIKRNEEDPEATTWTEIGLQSPPFPQDHYPVTNNITMEKGDLFGLRCTYYNYKDHDVEFGNQDSNEMCEFAILYATKRGNETPFAFIGETGDFDKTGLKNIPDDA